MENIIDLTTELDDISKLANLNVREIDSLMLEIGQRIIAILKIERINVWLFNEDKTHIKSVSEYDLRTKRFSKDNVIPRSIGPKYFECVERNKILVVDDVYKSAFTTELINSYLIPFNIVSLMDVPLRISGELVGVICFEKIGDTPKIFSEKEQSFALSVSFVLASILEAKFNNDVKNKFNALLKEKNILADENKLLHSEMSDRSNYSLQLLNKVTSELKLDAAITPDEYSIQLEKYLHRILEVNNIISSNFKMNKIIVADFFTACLNHFCDSNMHLKNALKYYINTKNEAITFDKALMVGLIVFNIFENAVNKLALQNDLIFVISITIVDKQNIKFQISENGNFNNTIQTQNFTELDLLTKLARKNNFILNNSNQLNSNFEFQFSLTL